MTATPEASLHPRRDPTQRDWHEFLTSAERVEVEALEKNARILDQRRSAITRHLQLWRSRCLQRRRFGLLAKARADAAAAAAAERAA
jgi:hypothetical protein